MVRMFAQRFAIIENPTPAATQTITNSSAVNFTFTQAVEMVELIITASAHVAFGETATTNHPKIPVATSGWTSWSPHKNKIKYVSILAASSSGEASVVGYYDTND